MMTHVKISVLAVLLAAMVSGCTTGPNSQSSSGPTVSGYIDTGAQKSFK
jgi:hypothetical protein